MTRQTWHQLRVKEIVKCIFKSNLTSSDRGTRHNSKIVDSWGEGGRGERFSLMAFVKRIALWAHWGVALRHPQRVRLSRVIQVSSEGLAQKLKTLTYSCFLLRIENLSHSCVIVVKKGNERKFVWNVEQAQDWQPLKEHRHHQFHVASGNSDPN